MSRQIGNVQSLALNFFIILPSWVFQPSCLRSTLLESPWKMWSISCTTRPQKSKKKKILWTTNSVTISSRVSADVNAQGLSLSDADTIRVWGKIYTIARSMTLNSCSHSTVSLRFMKLQVAWNKLGTDYKKKTRTKTQKGVAQYKS